MTFEVNLEDLIGSAARTTGQCEDLASGHLLSDNRIEAAQAGWVDSSAVALRATLDRWQHTSRGLLTRLGEYAQALHAAAAGCAAAERDRTQAFRPGGVATER